MTTNNKYVLEKKKRLSHSILWQLQRNFFDQQGIEAWRQGLVPHYITSNPFIAAAYAKMVFSFLRDWQISPQGREHTAPATTFSLDPSQPVYIVELGAGPGRFSYHFLKKFLRIYDHSTLEAIPFKYIMTDISPHNLDYWRTHPSLTPLVKAGHLDFALFNVGQDQTLTLHHSGETLTAQNVRNPIIVLANYIFDSVPQDCFYIKENRLFESLVTVSSSQEEPDLMDPELIKRIKVTYDHQPTIASYYDQKDLNQLLRTYQNQLNDTTLLFPRAALDCIRYFHQLAGGRLLLLSGDKGYIRKESLVGWKDQELTIHGSFSMMVNYHAIAQYILNLGGQVLQVPHSHDSLNISAFLTGQPAYGYRETRYTYYETIEAFGPDDFFVLKERMQQHYDAMTVPQMLAYLRLSGWDASIFFDAFSALYAGAAEADDTLRQDLYQMTQQVWEMYYPIGEIEDIPFQLGMLLYHIAYYPEALVYFQRSLQLHGPDASTAYNISLCYYAMKKMETALEWINKTLDLDPAFHGGMTLWRDIQAAIDKAA